MGDTEQYRLIIYSNPSDSKSHENRRFVRSHVTKRQHRSMKNQSSSSNSSSCQRNRRNRNTDNNPSLRHAVAAVSRQIETGLPIFMPPQPAPQELSPVDSLGLLSPTFQTNRSFDEVYANSFQLSRSGSISSASVQLDQQPQHHPQQQHHAIYESAPMGPVSYATPPPEYQDPCRPRMPRAELPYIVPNSDAQSAYEASILLLKSSGTIAQEYELTLESFACAKISAALLALSTRRDDEHHQQNHQQQQQLPSDGLMRAIAHMAHYDQIAAARQQQHTHCAIGGGNLFNHHMECLVDCVNRVGGFTQLRPDLQTYVLQVDHAVASFRGTAPFFAAAGASPLMSPA